MSSKQLIQRYVFFHFGIELSVSVFRLHAIQFSQLLHWQVFMYTCYRFCHVLKKTITPNFPFSLPWVAVFFFSFHSMMLALKTHSLRNNHNKILIQSVYSLTSCAKQKWQVATFYFWGMFFSPPDFWSLITTSRLQNSSISNWSLLLTIVFCQETIIIYIILSAILMLPFFMFLAPDLFLRAFIYFFLFAAWPNYKFQKIYRQKRKTSYSTSYWFSSRDQWVSSGSAIIWWTISEFVWKGSSGPLWKNDGEFDL